MLHNYTVFDKKEPLIFDHNYRISWSVFIIFVPLETRINALTSGHMQFHFNLTMSGKIKNSTTANLLLQCVLLNRLFQTFAESRSVFVSYPAIFRKFLAVF